MQGNAAAIMTRTVWSVLEDDSVEKVEELMNRHRLSSVPVVDARGAVFGILSNSDLLRFREKGGNPKVVKAWELCTFHPIEVSPSTPALEVARTMVQHRVHHVVVTENGKMVGFVSSLDFVERYLLDAGAR
jgi:CBS domain-containing protein